MNQTKMLGDACRDGQHSAAPNRNFHLENSESIARANLEIMATNSIRELSVPANIRGYFYLREAIILASDDMVIVSAVTKILYPDIAKMFDTSASRVERSIRHAIETAWVRCDLETREKFFGYSVANAKYRPSNSEFIATIADRIKLQIKFGSSSF